MTDKYIDYENLLPDMYRNNEFWAEFTAAMSEIFNPVIHNPTEKLANIRGQDTEAYYSGLNCQMLGFRVPVLSFDDAEYRRLMQFLGTFVQTRGASTKFIDFIGFIKNGQFDLIPLWASDITDSGTLDAVPGTPVWEGGDWFPTPYYDVSYDLELFPIDEALIGDIFHVLAPIHLVLRYIVGAFRDTAPIYLKTGPSLEILHDFSAASR